MPRLKGTVLETVTFPRWLFLLFPYLFIHNEEQLLKSQRDCTSIFKGSKERGKYEDWTQSTARFGERVSNWEEGGTGEFNPQDLWWIKENIVSLGRIFIIFPVDFNSF